MGDVKSYDITKRGRNEIALGEIGVNSKGTLTGIWATQRRVQEKFLRRIAEAILRTTIENEEWEGIPLVVS